MTKRNLVYALLLVLGSCASGRKIIDKPIVFDETRKIMTIDYLSDRYGLTANSPTIVPKMIVLHWTVLPTLEATFDAFEKSILPTWRPELENASALNVSSQFLVDRDGKIYRLLPETTMARHVIGLNHCAIGIENVGGTKELPLTEAQLKSNIWLVKYLTRKYDIDYLIGHYEYTNFEGHPLWLEKDENYRTEKTDPGEDFMRKVRNATKNLKFKPVPQKSPTNELQIF
jgi:N-acetyl-anhydromuramyl-L-alanine amidase AmpD